MHINLTFGESGTHTVKLPPSGCAVGGGPLCWPGFAVTLASSQRAARPPGVQSCPLAAGIRLRVKSEAAAFAQPRDPDTPSAGWRTGCGTCGDTAAALGGLRGTAHHPEPADLQPPLQGAPRSLSSTLGSDICDEGLGRTAGDRIAQTYD